jgi:hypothetical protein
VDDLPCAVFFPKAVGAAEPKRHFGAVRLGAGHIPHRHQPSAFEAIAATLPLVWVLAPIDRML